MGSLVAYDILTRPNTMRRASVSLGSSLPQLDLKGQMSGLSRRQSSESVLLYYLGTLESLAYRQEVVNGIAGLVQSSQIATIYAEENHCFLDSSQKSFVCRPYEVETITCLQRI